MYTPRHDCMLTPVCGGALGSWLVMMSERERIRYMAAGDDAHANTVSRIAGR